MQRKWSDEELEFINNNYREKGLEYCANYLNRSKSSISNQATFLGLKRTHAFNNITKEFLIEEYKNKRRVVDDIIKDIGVTKGQFYHALRKHGVEMNGHATYIDRRLRENNHAWKGHGEIFGTHWNTIVKCGKHQDLGFNITIEYIWDLFLKQNRRCALSGIVLEFSKNSKKYRYATTASLDRIDSNSGYLIGNVQWVHKDINMMKTNLPQRRFIDWCKLVANNMDNISDNNILSQ